MSESKTNSDARKAYLEKLGQEIDALEKSAESAGAKAESWVKQEKEGLNQALQEAEEEAQRHWTGLKAAIAAYRSHTGDAKAGDEDAESDQETKPTKPEA